jgi:HK97 gp10 family phage protein
MAGLSVEIKGLQELQGKLEKEALLGSPTRKFLGKAALSFERQAKIFSPVDTGRLRASIMTKVVVPEANPMAGFASVFTETAYASFVEYGKGKPRHTGRIPFWRPAFETAKGKINEYMDEARAAILQFWRS